MAGHIGKGSELGLIYKFATQMNKGITMTL